jgi:peptidoglycan hydrolase-like protein with peptidoglycan-binding domain
MPAQDISTSVGQGGVNKAADVVIVQNLLVARGFPGIGRADGICGPKTIAAIKAYQAGFLRHADGKVDPGGTTWRHLSAAFTGRADTPPPAGSAGSLLEPVPRPSSGSINLGLQAVSNSYMLAKLGQPLREGGYTSLCQTPTDPKLRRNLVTDTVGPFRVTGLVPAVLSLKEVMADIAAEQPAAYRALGTAGMLCCRLVRGSATAISNHSWGTAIDLTLNGVLDAYGDNKVQRGLTLIAPIFNRHSWYWGAAFGKEDGMHFEGSRAKIDAWAAQLS